MCSGHKLDIEELDIENNPYYRDNPENFNELLQLIQTSNAYIRSLKCIGAQGHSKNREYLLNWVLNKTQQLDNTYTLVTRCYWIIHGYIEFPKCQNYLECHNTLIHQNVHNIYDGYRTCCCSQQCRDKMRVKHTQQNLMNKYGVINVFQLDDVKDKIRATILNTYGVDNISRLENIKYKKEQTCLNNYGVKHPLQSSEIIEKFKNTCLNKYGCTNPLQNDEIKNNVMRQSLKKYGVECSFQAESVKNKIKMTHMERYGVEYSMQSAEIRENR